MIFLKPQLYSLISRLKKWHPETGEDVDFESDPLINWYTGTIIEDEKGFIYLMNASESFFPVESKILRFHPSGQLDVTFKPEVPTQMDGVLRSFAIVEDQEETSLWAGGAFARFDGNETSGLVRLDLAETHGFSEWISAAARGTSELLQGDDPDHDGSTNFTEYAAGTDPLNSISNPHPRLGNALKSWRIPIGARATEVARAVEVSDDLQNWRAAEDEDDIVISTNERWFEWKLGNGEVRLMSRLTLQSE